MSDERAEGRNFERLYHTQLQLGLLCPCAFLFKVFCTRWLVVIALRAQASAAQRSAWRSEESRPSGAPPIEQSTPGFANSRVRAPPRVHPRGLGLVLVLCEGPTKSFI